MNTTKKIAILILCAFSLQTAAFASNVQFVSSNEKSGGDKPKFSIFSLFKRKPSPSEAVRETVVTQNAESFTALDGMLSVKKNTPAEGSLNSTVPGTSAVVFSIEAEPSKGTVEITDAMTGDFVYTPNDDALGDDSFVFAAESVEHNQETATITVTISEVETPGDTDGNPPPVPAFRYEDMLNHWGAISAGALANRGILVGFKIGGKHFFYPEIELTRGDFILYLVSGLGIDVGDYSEISSPFADAQETPAWMNLQAKAAYDAGIIKGSLEEGGIYLYPDEKLTRLEAAAMLNNTIKPHIVSVTAPEYSDMYLVPEWGVPYIQNMTAYGLMQGYADNTARPFAKITRAMAAEIINQTLKYRDEHPEVIRELSNEMDRQMEY